MKGVLATPFISINDPKKQQKQEQKKIYIEVSGNDSTYRFSAVDSNDYDDEKQNSDHLHGIHLLKIVDDIFLRLRNKKPRCIKNRRE